MKKENETSLSLLKRFALTILCLLSSSIASVWTGANFEPSSTRTIDGKKFFIITKAEELAWISSQVNQGNSEMNVWINNDIHFASHQDSISTVSWVPIGNTNENSFNGLFKGNNHKITGLLVNGKNNSFYGLFGSVGSNAIIQDIILKAKIINENTRSGTYNYTYDMNSFFKIYIGGIAGHNKGLITNCHFDGILGGSNKASFQSIDGGGIVGLNDGIIKNASSKGSVNVGTFSYGVTSSYSYDTGSSGGIVGFNNGTIDSTYNFSDVSATNSRAGGIAGVNNGFISRCVNKGKMDGSHYIGGITGSNLSKISDCINEGHLPYTGSYSGGLIGNNDGSISTSYSITGTILSRSTNGALAGRSKESDKIGACFYDNDSLPNMSAIGDGESPNAIGLKTTSMQQDEFAWVLNTANGTLENSSTWSRFDGYPVFANDTLLAIRKIVFDDGENTVIYYTNYKGLIPQLPDVPKAPEGKAFAGWIDADGKTCDINTVFSKDQTIAASFLDWDDVLYTIQFIGSNGKTLDVVSVHAGEIPEYTGAIPTKTATKAYRYTFNKWSPDLTAATWHKSYEASFDSTLIPYKVTFKDYDGTELNSTDVDFGTKPSYSAIPKRAMTDEYIYTFRGWYPAVELVSDVATYTATYDSTLREYQITFKNGDVTLQSTNVAYGTKPGLLEGMPTKAATKQWTYTFKGWTPEIANVSETMTYTAVFDSSLNKYMVAFVSGASTLQSSEVAYGTVPEFSKSEPTKTSTAKYDYTFKAWTPTLTKVVDDATYIAAFDSTIRSYEITFQNGKNTLQSEPIEFGKTPVYSGETPTKMESEGYTYTFAGWEPAVVSVSDKAVYIASFDSVAKKFDVVFMNEKDTLSKQSVEYGVVPKYTGSNPSKKNSEKYEYNFIGWNEEISAVVKEAVYTAKFDSTEIKSESLTQIRGSNVSIRAVGGKQIALNNLPFGQKFYVMDMQGRVVNQGVTSMSNTLISVNSVGRYIVKTNNLTQLLNVR